MLVWSNFADEAAVQLGGKCILPLMLRLSFMTRSKIFTRRFTLRVGLIPLPVAGSMRNKA